VVLFNTPPFLFVRKQQLVKSPQQPVDNNSLSPAKVVAILYFLLSDSMTTTPVGHNNDSVQVKRLNHFVSNNFFIFHMKGGMLERFY
jgi:hypothetical protein